MADYVASQTISLDDQLSAGAAAATDALNRLADAGDGAAASTDAVNASVTRAGPSAAALANRFDPATKAANDLAAAQAKLTAAVNTMAAAVDSGSTSQAQADAVLASLTVKVQTAQAAFDQLGVSQLSMAKQAAGLTDSFAETAGAAGDLQARIDALTGVSGGSSFAARAADIAAYGSALDATRAKFDPMFAAQQRYQASLEEISIAVKNGAIDETVAAGARQRANATLEEATAGANAAAGAHAGFYREIVILGHEVVVGNFSRIPGSLLVLAERSGNLESIFQGVIKVVTSFAGLMTIAGVAGVAALGYIGYEADAAITKQIALQNSLQATRDDYIAVAAEVKRAASIAVQATPGLSLADASAAGGIISASPDFTGTDLQRAHLIEVATDISRVFNETVVKAANDLAAAMENPGQAADKLVGKLRGMTQATADNITVMALAGDKAGAFAEYEGVLAAAVTGATAKLSPLHQALRDVETAFNDSSAAGKGLGEGIGTAIDKAVSWALERIADLLGGLKRLHDWDAQFLPWAQGGAPAGASTPLAAGTSVPDAINTIGAQLNVQPGAITLAQQLAPVESSTGMNDRFGHLQTSSTGALGAMQVEPMNAGGQDLSTLTGNVTAGMTLLSHLYSKYGGDQTLILAAYNLGEGRVDSLLAKGQSLPSSVQSYVDKVLSEPTSGTISANGASAPNVLGVSNNSQDTVNAALKDASGTVAEATQKTQALITSQQAALKIMEQTGQAGTTAYDAISESLSNNEAKLDNLRTPLGQVGASLDDNRLAAQRMEGAYNTSYEAVARTTAGNQAYGEAIKLVGRDSDAFDSTVASLTQRYLDAADATNKAALAQQTLSNGDQLQYLKAETDSLGTNTEARDAMLSRLKAEQELRQKNISETSAEGQAYLSSVDAISAQTSALAKNEQTINDLQNLATQAFDSIGTAITNAFAAGGKSALDFGNLARTVLSSVTSELVKIAALNPILNSLFGGNRTTLSDVGSLLGGSSGGGGSILGSLFGGTGGGSGIQEIGSETIGGSIDLNATSGVQQIGSEIIPGSGGNPLGGGGSLLSLLGLGNSGGIGSALGLTGPGGVLSSSLWTGASGSATTLGGLLGGAGLGFGAGSLFNGLLGGNQLGGTLGSGAGSLAGAAIGSIIPGVGTIIGGLLGGLLGGGLGGLFGNTHPSDKTEGYNENLVTTAGYVTGNQPGSSEYSGANSAAAKALASTIVGGIDAIASAFNITSGGGIAGSGGLIVDKVGTNGITAQLSNKGAVVSSGDDSTAGATAVTNGTIKSWVAEVSSNFDATTQSILKEIDFTSQSARQEITALAGAVTNGKLDATQLQALPHINTASASSAINDLAWIKNTYEPTINSTANQGSIATATAALNTSFESLIATATRLGLSTSALTNAQNTQIQAINDAARQTVNASGASITAGSQFENGDALGSKLTAFDQAAAVAQLQLTAEFKGLYGDAYASQADYVKQTGLLSATLAEQRMDLVRSWNAQQDTVGASWTANITAGWKAQASIASYSDNPGTVAWGQQLNQAADLANFDAQTKTTEDSYSQGLLNTYGAGYAQSATYAQQMIDLEHSLAEQRLAIQAQYAQQAKAAEESAASSASSVITSLTSYAESLQTGSASPLNAKSQYGLASSQFGTEAQLAEGGNVNALGQIQSYAQAFLASSSNLYGSGAQYAADYAEVLQVLQTISAIPPGTLTQDFMTAALQDQTDQLTVNDNALLAAINGLKMELMQQNSRPQ